MIETNKIWRNKMKQPNPNNYDSEEEYEKAQSQYEDYADEKYEQEKDGN